MRTHYIYISGLGDKLDGFRRLMMLWQRFRGRRIVLVPMKWADKKETYQQKQERIRRAISAVPQGASVTLIGESAGGAMAIRMLCDYPNEIDRVVTICGYNHTRDGITPMHDTIHPAFVRTVAANDESHERIELVARHIRTIMARNDSIVETKYSRVSGAEERYVSGKNHQLAIVRIVVLKGKLWQ